MNNYSGGPDGARPQATPTANPAAIVTEGSPATIPRAKRRQQG